MGSAMQENNLSTVSGRARLERYDGNEQLELRLNFENELDKLAVLMQEVREQSARVQAAADAIGEQILLGSPTPPLPASLRR